MSLPALSFTPVYERGVASFRRIFRSSEAALVLLAVGVGVAAGLLMLVQRGLAHSLQSFFYGLSGASLSAAASIDPWRLLALPLLGLFLGYATRAISRRWRTPIDVVEANALHGGAIPVRDTLVVCAQTIVSNGAGASVGLEAAYAQAGGGFASVIGQWLRLRRASLRVLVGAGAGAAVGAAFGAPLTGAFYAFEIVIGAYTPAAIAPVAAACIAATLLGRLVGVEPYIIALPGAKAITTADYLLFAALGIICALIGIAIMRGVTFCEAHFRRLAIPDAWRPAVGGLLLIPLALITPQALSAGHGALHMDLGAEVGLRLILLVLVIKVAASTISLGFGFRGGLFFASLFMGSLVGQLFAGALAHQSFLPTVDPGDAALIGMAAMAVAIVGGPMTMSMLVLEVTHDFVLTGAAVTAALCASTLVRELFGYSFSTWRLHTRGENIRSARDVGWARALTAGKMMRRSVETLAGSASVAEFRRRFPLGATTSVVLLDAAGRYAGIVETAKLYAPGLTDDTEVGTLASLSDFALDPSAGVRAVIAAFDRTEADDLAVVSTDGEVLGTLSERFVHRRYADEVEKAQRDLFGE
ncbi:chloride channel protein [Sphingomonas sp. KRR8]|uniref:chloride channel protein n=1 Tax=Sphingomonas sp. KRR8 TaxID=2942996 RepID=UPI00201FEE47|nr:chloride channel protein [Sphingomonas sp. KRR8]URD59809.1 chloride channel protein [Sphingomonas sp. KRR8]